MIEARGQARHRRRGQANRGGAEPVGGAGGRHAGALAYHRRERRGASSGAARMKSAISTMSTARAATLPLHAEFRPISIASAVAATSAATAIVTSDGHGRGDAAWPSRTATSGEVAAAARAGAHPAPIAAPSPRSRRGW